MARTPTEILDGHHNSSVALNFTVAVETARINTQSRFLNDFERRAAVTAYELLMAAEKAWLSTLSVISGDEAVHEATEEAVEHLREVISARPSWTPRVVIGGHSARPAVSSQIGGAA